MTLTDAEISDFHSGVYNFIFVENVDYLFKFYKDSGVNIVNNLQNMPWKIREFSFKDLYGNYYRIGQSIPD